MRRRQVERLKVCCTLHCFLEAGISFLLVGGVPSHTLDCPITVELAYGFVQVANEAMCRPIRNLTQMRGYVLLLNFCLWYESCNIIIIFIYPVGVFSFTIFLFLYLYISHIISLLQPQLHSFMAFESLVLTLLSTRLPVLEVLGHSMLAPWREHSESPKCTFTGMVEFSLRTGCQWQTL